MTSHSDNVARNRAVRFFRSGSTQKELLDNWGRVASTDCPSQSMLSRWMRKAIADDPDLEIEHSINRRKRRPGLYANWIRSGQILLGPFRDPVTDVLYLGAGMDFIPIGVSQKPKIVRTGEPGPPRPISDYRSRTEAFHDFAAVHVVSSKDLQNLTFREIARNLRNDAKGLTTNRYLRERLANVSYATVRRIYQKYSPAGGKAGMKQIAFQEGSNE